MEAYEIPLVIFTVLTQWAVGIVIAIALFEWFKPKFLQSVGKHAFKKSVYLALGLSIGGTIASLLHLGNPFKSYMSLIGTFHSWLSREIIAVIAFNIFLIVLFYVWWKMSDKEGLRKWLGSLTALVGIVLVLISGMVYYQMALHPEWNHWTTFGNFLLTGLLLGFLTVSYFVLKGIDEEDTELVFPFMGRYLAVLIVGLLVTIAGSLISPGIVDVAEAVAVSPLFWIRIFGSLLIPATLIIYMLVGKKSAIAKYVLAAATFAFIGELSGRALFYHTVMSQYPWF